MLSGETAAGKYPVESLRTMVRIAVRAEDDIDYRARFRKLDFSSGGNITHAISHAACTSALDLGAKAIVAFTLSGRTAQEVSAFRPDCRIIACTSSEQTFRQMNLNWGVTALIVKDEENLDDLFERGIQSVVDAGLLQSGEMAVVTAGVPIGVSGSTNFIRVMHA
jgi:pyruvate kinase